MAAAYASAIDNVTNDPLLPLNATTHGREMRFSLLVGADQVYVHAAGGLGEIEIESHFGRRDVPAQGSTGPVLKRECEGSESAATPC